MKERIYVAKLNRALQMLLEIQLSLRVPDYLIKPLIFYINSELFKHTKPD